VVIRWTGLTPWEFELPFPGSLTSTFLVQIRSWSWDFASILDNFAVLASHMAYGYPAVEQIERVLY